MLSLRLLPLLLSIALFLRGVTHAAHTYRHRAAAVHAATGESIFARSQQEHISKRAGIALTLPRTDLGVGGDGSTLLDKRDALNANLGLMAPTGMVEVGGKMHRMVIIPSYPQTVFTAEAKYTGGNGTPFKDRIKQQDGTYAVDTIYLDTILLGGVTALNVAVGSSSIPIPSISGGSIHGYGADGVLGFMPDSNPAGYSARVNKTLKGYASSLPNEEVLTISLDPGYSVGGKATISRRTPVFSVKTAYSDQWAAPGVHVNGFPLEAPATVDVGSPFIYVPLATAEAIFQKAGIKTRTVPWRGSTVLEGVLEDCVRGFSMIVRFGGESERKSTVLVVGPSGAYRGEKRDECIAALRGSPEGDCILGWPIFRSAEVSYNAQTLEIGIDV